MAPAGTLAPVSHGVIATSPRKCARRNATASVREIASWAGSSPGPSVQTEQVKPQLLNAMQQQEFQKMMGELRAKAKIE